MKSLLVFFEKLTVGKKLLLLASPIITLLISMKLILLGLWLLITIDLLTGIRKNLHVQGIKFNPLKYYFWMAIKSYLLRKTWRKTYEYGIGIIVVAILETLILGGTPVSILSKTFSLTELSVVLPAMIEAWSIFENLEGAGGVNLLKRVSVLLPPDIRTILGVNKTKD